MTDEELLDEREALFNKLEASGTRLDKVTQFEEVIIELEQRTGM